MHQLSSVLRNVYYHPLVGCVTQRYSTFNPTTRVKVSGKVRGKLSVVHLAHLLNAFGLSFLNNVNKHHNSLCVAFFTCLLHQIMYYHVLLV